METPTRYAKCKCQHCNQAIEFEYSASGTAIPCPHCSMETQLFIPRIQQSKPAPPPKSMDPVKLYLSSIRSNSCYKVLRGLIDICFGLVLICIGLMVTTSWVFYLVGNGEGFSVSIIQIIASTIFGILLAVISTAVRQSALLLIDIADTLLHEHSK